MTALEHDLDRLRERLHAAAASDLRRRARRRRRIARFAAVPVVGLTLTAAAAAVSPWWNEPAPPRVQSAFDANSGRPAGAPEPARPTNFPDGPLGLWARDGELSLYGTSSPSGHCSLAARGDEIAAHSCSDAGTPPPGEIRLDSLGGATHREANIASGQVATAGAKTVTLSTEELPNAAVVDVGHDGWFVAQMPDSTLDRLSIGRSASDPGPPNYTGVTSAVAHDAAGNVVARSRPRR